MNWSAVLHRLAGLLRTRVILSAAGLFIIYKQPAIGQWVVILVGLALGVSAIDAVKGSGDGSNSGNPK